MPKISFTVRLIRKDIFYRIHRKLYRGKHLLFFGEKRNTVLVSKWGIYKE